MKSGHAGKKCNFLHDVFPLHSIYTIGPRPPHFLSILADEILRMVSLGRRNTKLLRSAKKWKSHPACLLPSPMSHHGTGYLSIFSSLETSHFTNFSNPKNHWWSLLTTAIPLLLPNLIRISRGRTWDCPFSKHPANFYVTFEEHRSWDYVHLKEQNATPNFPFWVL